MADRSALGGSTIPAFPPEALQQQASAACEAMLAFNRTARSDGTSYTWRCPDAFVIDLLFVAVVGPKVEIRINDTTDICDHSLGESGWKDKAGDTLRLMALTNPLWPAQNVAVQSGKHGDAKAQALSRARLREETADTDPVRSLEKMAESWRAQDAARVKASGQSHIFVHGYTQSIRTYPHFVAVNFTQAGAWLTGSLSCGSREDAEPLYSDATGGKISPLRPTHLEEALEPSSSTSSSPKLENPASRDFYITRWVIPSPVSFRPNVPAVDRASGLAVLHIVHTDKAHTAFREPFRLMVDAVQRAHPGNKSAFPKLMLVDKDWAQLNGYSEAISGHKFEVLLDKARRQAHGYASAVKAMLHDLGRDEDADNLHRLSHEAVSEGWAEHAKKTGDKGYWTAVHVALLCWPVEVDKFQGLHKVAFVETYLTNLATIASMQYLRLGSHFGGQLVVRCGSLSDAMTPGRVPNYVVEFPLVLSRRGECFKVRVYQDGVHEAELLQEELRLLDELLGDGKEEASGSVDSCGAEDSDVLGLVDPLFAKFYRLTQQWVGGPHMGTARNNSLMEHEWTMLKHVEMKGPKVRVDVFVHRARQINMGKEAGFLNTWRIQAAEQSTAQAAAQDALASGSTVHERIKRESRAKCEVELGLLLRDAKAGIASGEVKAPDYLLPEQVERFKALNGSTLYLELQAASGGSRVEECLTADSPEKVFQIWCAVQQQAVKPASGLHEKQPCPGCGSLKVAKCGFCNKCCPDGTCKTHGRSAAGPKQQQQQQRQHAGQSTYGGMGAISCLASGPALATHPATVASAGNHWDPRHAQELFHHFMSAQNLTTVATPTGQTAPASSAPNSFAVGAPAAVQQPALLVAPPCSAPLPATWQQPSVAAAFPFVSSVPAAVQQPALPVAPPCSAPLPGTGQQPLMAMAYPFVYSAPAAIQQPGVQAASSVAALRLAAGLQMAAPEISFFPTHLLEAGQQPTAGPFVQPFMPTMVFMQPASMQQLVPLEQQQCSPRRGKKAPKQRPGNYPAHMTSP
ncbi:hypothetical protein N2152v2_008053 [Parachlorella kessleri]